MDFLQKDGSIIVYNLKIKFTGGLYNNLNDKFHELQYLISKVLASSLCHKRSLLIFQAVNPQLLN
jgi:hypothetical protein